MDWQTLWDWLSNPINRQTLAWIGGGLAACGVWGVIKGFALDLRGAFSFSRYRRRYLQDVIYQHRIFDVKGLSTQGMHALDLERVFVDLSISPIPPHRASPDMLRKLPEDLREGRHTVWDFLQPVKTYRQWLPRLDGGASLLAWIMHQGWRV